ncbi:MAG: pro-sigmaK processing inhibitor BofA family protein [Clostridia bacterium]|nr:pro-sigmaK processing inhibitor BofA family protein [Clostridia bacterium]
MNINTVLLISTLIISAIIILAASLKSKKFLKSVILSALSGLSGLFAVHVLSWFTPLTLPVNLFTVSVSAVSGIPGVIGLLITAIAV